ncbi:hypothetical protein F5Y11DRAFT_348021 [Daldinia sp. FL1419]|nr:hypothetical protein F5Y11DRAFT_348021 [Daldinia sp. FL1419]
MDVHDFPDITINDREDSTNLYEAIDILSDYIDDLGWRKRLSDREESLLKRADKWIPSVISKLNSARVRFVNTDDYLWQEARAMLDRLRDIEPKIKHILEENDKQKA